MRKARLPPQYRRPLRGRASKNCGGRNNCRAVGYCAPAYDQFIAFQVIVRNLNATQEFVLHNTSIALDTGRFYAGVDRMLVRNTQQHGNYYDRRNFWMRVLEVAGDIAAGAAPYASGDTQSGIAVFRAAFIPGMQKIFPDRYLNQINALND